MNSQYYTLKHWSCIWNHQFTYYWVPITWSGKKTKHQFTSPPSSTQGTEYTKYQLHNDRHSHRISVQLEMCGECQSTKGKIACFEPAPKKDLEHELQFAWNERPLWCTRKRSDSIPRRFLLGSQSEGSPDMALKTTH